MLNRALFTTAISAAFMSFLPAPLPASAQTTLMLPSNNTISQSGRALSITNTFADPSGTGTLPTAIAGIGSGDHGIGLLGSGSGANGTGVKGTGTNYGGQFTLTGTPAATSSAIFAQNSGGSSPAGYYGSAGQFQITNSHNEFAAVSIASNGINSHSLYVVNSGGTNGHVSYADGDEGGVAAWFEITKPSFSSVLFSVNSADTGVRGPYGSAATFAITSANNTSNVVDISTSTSLATALNVTSGGEQAQGIQTYTYGNSATSLDAADLSTTGGKAVFAQSLHGTTAYFQNGTPGLYSHCAYAGGPGWSCSSDRNLKKDFQPADLDDVLKRLNGMPVYYYRMKEGAPTRYLGPTAQDFHAAFAIGENDTTINTANAQGVALAAAKGLAEKLRAAEARIAVLEQQVAAQRAEVVSLRQSESARLERVEAALARMPGQTPIREASAAP